MTFPEFQAQRTETPDIGAALLDEGMAGVPGYLYGRLWIEKTATGFATIDGRADLASADIAELERILYDSYIGDDRNE